MSKPKWDPELYRKMQWEGLRLSMGALTWQEAWRAANVSQWIIDQFEHRYGAPPEWLTKLVVEDDKKCGIGKLTFGTDESCKDHDVLMLLDRHGYRIEPIPQTQGRFLVTSIAIGIVAAGTALVAIPKGVVGATVGTILQVVREVF
jgi:hypothetical protein